MRFKAKASKGQVYFMSALLAPLSRLSDTSYVKMDSSKLRISSKSSSAGSSSFASQSASSDVLGFVEVALSGIFSNHKIESLSANQILLEVDLSHLRSALLSVSSAMLDGMDSMCYLKLAKRQSQPCLCVETDETCEVRVSHDLPVKIVQVEAFKGHLPPTTSAPDVQIYLPPPNVPTMRTAVERLRFLGTTPADFIFVEGSMRGDLSFTGMVTGACSKVSFEGLRVEFTDCKASAEFMKRSAGVQQNEADEFEDDPDMCATVKVGWRKLNELFRWQVPLQRWISESTLCIVENEMLILHCRLPRFGMADGGVEETGFLTVYSPTTAFDPEADFE